MAGNNDKLTRKPPPTPAQDRKPIREDNRTGTFDRGIKKDESRNGVMPRDSYRPDPPPKKGGK